METSVRNELHKIIDEASELKLLEIYDWINNGMPGSIQYTPGEIKMFYDRLEEHEQGKSKSYTIEESFAIVRNNKQGNDL